MPDQESPAPPTPAGGKSALKSHLITGLILLGVMGLEGAGIVLAMRAMGSGAQDAAARGGSADGAGGSGAGRAHVDSVEMTITELDAFNSLSGRVNVYHIEVCALVALERTDTFAELVTARDSTIRDRIQTIIRRSEPAQLSEPDLATLKRQIAFELGRIFADETLIQELLIPELLQSRATL
ncbi:MAG: hypothetical protein IH988_04105 [Planctomycetes bacterium]|nr:hypothetical protein [Planctomycetota bacterium]